MLLNLGAPTQYWRRAGVTGQGDLNALLAHALSYPYLGPGK